MAFCCCNCCKLTLILLVITIVDWYLLQIQWQLPIRWMAWSRTVGLLTLHSNHRVCLLHGSAVQPTVLVSSLHHASPPLPPPPPPPPTKKEEENPSIFYPVSQYSCDFVIESLWISTTPPLRQKMSVCFNCYGKRPLF